MPLARFKKDAENVVVYILKRLPGPPTCFQGKVISAEYISCQALQMIIGFRETVAVKGTAPPPPPARARETACEL